MRPYDILRSTGFKLAIACASLFAIVTLATSVVAYLLIAKDLDNWLDRSISETTSYLTSELREGGFKALAESLEEHANAAEGDNEVYLLAEFKRKEARRECWKISTDTRLA